MNEISKNSPPREGIFAANTNFDNQGPETKVTTKKTEDKTKPQAVEKKTTTKTTTQKPVEKKTTTTKPVVTKTPAAKDAVIAKSSVTTVVASLSKDRFITALVGSNPDPNELKKAEIIFSREVSFAFQAFKNNPYLEKCAENDKIALIHAITNIAQTKLTLNPVLKLGYLVPFDKKITFMSSYMGKREIVMRTGSVKDAYARLVFEGDEFEVKMGTDGYIKHVPDAWSDKTPETLKGGYWVCVLKDGTKKFDVMPKKEIESIKKRSQSVAKGTHSPWLTDYFEMCKKTIFNRGFKEMPKTGISEEQLSALEADGKMEEEILRSWLRQNKTHQDTFEEDEEENDFVSDAKIVD